jgi:hypothetical protein
VDADTSLAAALDDIDDRLDELQTAYVQQIFKSHSEQGMSLQGAVQLAMIGRYFERIGDHAVNIGERVMYMVTGWLPEQTGAARQRLRDGGGGGAAGAGSEPRPSSADRLPGGPGAAEGDVSPDVSPDGTREEPDPGGTTGDAGTP